MTTLLAGAVALSALHAAIPNHWIPLVMIGRAEHWARRETLAVTALAGLAHTASTVLIGILIGVVGIRLSQSYEVITSLIAPVVLVALGALYIILDLAGKGGHYHFHSHQVHDAHEHDHDSEHEFEVAKLKGSGKGAIIASLAGMMFFSPCLEIEAYYFTAAAHGWVGILMVSGIYMGLTIAGMMMMVWLGLVGMAKLRWHFLEHHERLVTGILLMALGVAAFWFGH